MLKHTKLEISVGLFVILGMGALAYLSITLGGVELGRATYPIHARFSSVGDLKKGDAVKLAGVNVGEVTAIELVDYTAAVELGLSRTVELPTDTIASIQTSGLLGDAYVSLSPGAASDNLPANGMIQRTEPAISISDLLARYAFGSLNGEERERPAPRTSDPSSSTLDDL
jgi:phospholipid/cholesterol/gamma-HCH transport system substrate-binding protein